MVNQSLVASAVDCSAESDDDEFSPQEDHSSKKVADQREEQSLDQILRRNIMEFESNRNFETIDDMVPLRISPAQQDVNLDERGGQSNTEPVTT